MFIIKIETIFLNVESLSDEFLIVIFLSIDIWRNDWEKNDL